MLIYRVSNVFAHKKTIKQFLQLMIEQVWGGCAAFLHQFFRATVFLCHFFQFTDAFFWSILPIFAYFLLYIMCISSKSQAVFSEKIFVMYN